MNFKQKKILQLWSNQTADNYKLVLNCNCKILWLKRLQTNTKICCCYESKIWKITFDSEISVTAILRAKFSTANSN